MWAHITEYSTVVVCDMSESGSPTAGESLYDGGPALVDSSTRRHGGYVVRLALNDDETAYDLTVRDDPVRPVRTDGGERATGDGAVPTVDVRVGGLDPSYLDASARDLLRAFLGAGASD